MNARRAFRAENEACVVHKSASSESRVSRNESETRTSRVAQVDGDVDGVDLWRDLSGDGPGVEPFFLLGTVSHRVARVLTRRGGA